MNLKRMIVIMLVLLTGVLFYPGVVIILALGFLPTLGALATDVTFKKSQVFCVGCCNGAGMIPILVQLSQKQFSMQVAMDIIHDPTRLLVVLVGAGIGWVIAFAVPMLTINFYRNKDQKLVNQLIARHQHLKKLWGDSLPELEFPDQGSMSNDESSAHRPLTVSQISQPSKR